MFKKNINFFKSLGIFSIFLLILLTSLFFIYKNSKDSLKMARASSSDNIKGFAWSPNIGWISFNSTDCDSDGNGVFDGTPSGCPAAGTAFFDYGVKIDNATGDVSGYAWSSNIGWISFNRCGTDENCLTSDGDTSNPPSDDISSSHTGAIAKMDIGSHYGLITGWAQALSLKDNGWVRFSYAPDSGYFDSITFPITSLTLSGTNYATYIDPEEKAVHGWAWNASSADSDPEGIGWISFNCSDLLLCADEPHNVCETNSDCATGSCVDGCDVVDYKVTADVNARPTVNQLTAPNWNWTNTCANNRALEARLKWLYNDDSGAQGKAYQVLVNTNDLGDIPDAGDIAAADFNSGECSSAVAPAGNCQIDFVNSMENKYCLVNDRFCWFSLTKDIFPAFNYNTQYYWWVRVADNLGIWSNWVKYSTSADTSNDDGNLDTFRTYAHEFPEANISSWTPTNPSKDEDTIFLSNGSRLENTGADCFDAGCVDGNMDSTCCAFKWTPTNGVVVGADNASTSVIRFSDPINGGSVKLEVTDIVNPDNYTCEFNQSLNVKKKLPQWIEKK